MKVRIQLVGVLQRPAWFVNLSPLSDLHPPAQLLQKSLAILPMLKTSMDVTTISGASAWQQQQIANNVQSSVAAKVHDSQKTQGAAVLKLLDAATVPPSADGSLDVKA